MIEYAGNSINECNNKKCGIKCSMRWPIKNVNIMFYLRLFDLINNPIFI
jgi:hypothetical protein